MIKINPTYPSARKVSCQCISRILASGTPYIMPTAMLPIIPARMTLAETHSARERMKKKDIMTRISTTMLVSKWYHISKEVQWCILLGSS